MTRCPWAIHFGSINTRCDRPLAHPGSHEGPGLAAFPEQRIEWFARDRREYQSDRDDSTAWEDQWAECESGGWPAVILDDYEARCPGCGFTFSTLTDEPVMPRHWLSLDGRLVRVGSPPSVPRSPKGG